MGQNSVHIQPSNNRVQQFSSYNINASSGFVGFLRRISDKLTIASANWDAEGYHTQIPISAGANYATANGKINITANDSDSNKVIVLSDSQNVLVLQSLISLMFSAAWKWFSPFRHCADIGVGIFRNWLILKSRLCRQIFNARLQEGASKSL